MHVCIPGKFRLIRVRNSTTRIMFDTLHVSKHLAAVLNVTEQKFSAATCIRKVIPAKHYSIKSPSFVYIIHFSSSRLTYSK